MRCLFIFIAFLSFCVSGKSQGLHYSQHVYNPLYYNPSFTGFFDGFARINASYADRYRQSFGKDGMRTAFGAVDFNIPINSAYSDKSSVGVGAYFYNNKAGYNALVENAASFLLSYRITLDKDKRHTLSVGAGALYFNRSFSYGDLQFGNQFDGVGYNPNIGSGERVEYPSEYQFDASVGLLYSFRASDKFKGFVGSSFNHLLPQKGDIIGYGDLLRYNVHGGLDLSFGSVGLKPLIMFDHQLKNSELYTGVEFNYKVTSDKEGGLSLFAGPYIRVFNSSPASFSLYTLNAVAGIRYSNFTFLIATDNTINSSKKTFSGFNGFELGLTYVVSNSDTKQHKIYCPVF